MSEYERTLATELAQQAQNNRGREYQFQTPPGFGAYSGGIAGSVVRLALARPGMIGDVLHDADEMMKWLENGK